METRRAAVKDAESKHYQNAVAPEIHAIMIYGMLNLLISALGKQVTL